MEIHHPIDVDCVSNWGLQGLFSVRLSSSETDVMTKVSRVKAPFVFSAAPDLQQTERTSKDDDKRPAIFEVQFLNQYYCYLIWF